MFSLNRIKEWRALIKTDLVYEVPEVAAGRKAEEFLKTIIESNLQYKGANCFIGKRVPSKKHKCRFEIDLIVLTKKHLHFLEVKNWSGELYSKDGKWIQKKRNGQEIEHPNLTNYNSEKNNVLIDYLASQGVKIDSSYISQKVIFMNSNLKMSSEIESDLDVIPKSKIDEYLASQRGTTLSERMLHSVIEACLDSEKGKVIIDGLFNSLHGEQVKMTQHAISALRTWDLINLYGGRIIQGDGLSLNIGEISNNLKKIPSEQKIIFKWNRSKVISLIITLFTDLPLGKTKIDNDFYRLTPSTDHIKFHAAGDKKPIIIPLNQLEWFCRG